MSNYSCTIYSNKADFDFLLNEIKAMYPKAKYEIETVDEFKTIYLTIKGGFFRADKKFKIPYRQRLKPSYKIENLECPLTRNLAGMLGFISALPSENETVQDLLLQMVHTMNCEFSVFTEEKNAAEFYNIVKVLSSKMDALVFAQPNTNISKSSTQHFLNKHLELILDTKGKNEVSDLEIVINSEYFDDSASNATEEQKQRKLKSEEIIQSSGLKVNLNLPPIASEKETQIRTPKEIAERIIALSLTNLVAFDTIPSSEAIKYLMHFNLLQILTPNEKDFLDNPTAVKKSMESWKVEGIWTLFWALNIIDDMEFPDHLADLNKVPQEQYPVGQGKDPNTFIANITTTRDKSEILDANDLYYRLDWACVDARIKNEEIEIVNPSVVYERHYALNWLIKYRDQEWDDVSADT